MDSEEEEEGVEKRMDERKKDESGGDKEKVEEGGESDIDQRKTEYAVEEEKVRHNTRTGVGGRCIPLVMV